MKENKDTLDELNKGCTMGLDALKFVIEKVDDSSFKKNLEEQYNEYEKVHNKIEKMYSKYSDSNPTETNTFNKTMTWTMLEIKTMKDTSNSKIAELLLQGTNMGIIEGRKLINHKPDIDKEVKEVLEEFVSMQEKQVENLKKYL